MKILYLYTEVMGYTLATMRALVQLGAEIEVVHWDQKKLTPYRVPPLPGITMHPRSSMSNHSILALVATFNPNITVVSGWQDDGYLLVCRKLRARRRPVVVGFDDQWHHTLRQRVAFVLAKFGYFDRFFSHAWVTGTRQFEYARRLGFSFNQIIYDLYSADIDVFRDRSQLTKPTNASYAGKRFLFVGRLEPVKGLDTLVSAWNLLASSRREWELCLIGDGSLAGKLQGIDGLLVKGFMQPDQLVEELEAAACFVLPSHREPWGVVVHEFAAAGLPLLLSDAVGAGDAFLIPGLNGSLFRAGNVDDLAAKMSWMMNRSDTELGAMALWSSRLADRITPLTSAANLLSLVSTNSIEV